MATVHLPAPDRRLPIIEDTSLTKPDKDDLLQVNQRPWVRRELSPSVRFIGLAAALAGVAGAIYLTMRVL